MARLFKFPNYSVVETNHIAAVYDGRIKAQFPTDKIDIFQNGQVGVVNEVEKTVTLPKTGKEMVYLHASEERIYEDHLGRSSFAVRLPNLPKMLALSYGDVFETNAVDGGTFANPTVAKANAKYGVPHTNGDIKLLSEEDGKAALETHEVVFEIVDFITLPNNQQGIKFNVIKPTE